INNEGCMVNRELTEDGLKNFATNTLGLYIFTTGPIPVLKRHDPRMKTVSSDRMLVQKLNTNDLQSRTAFNGTVVYAQNRRQQVVLSQQWPQRPGIHFSFMRPGWVDIPARLYHCEAVHARLKGRLCAVALGVDTILRLVLPVATVQPSGLFFQDQKSAPTHLPLARTSSSPAEEEKLTEILEELAQRFK
uniref:Uncharacterized protein n=1 Tax=Myotis lucifugus TaxID=59463 RepID=G1PWZ7_MYOLU